MEIRNEDYQEVASEDVDESSRHSTSALEDESPAAGNALMIRPVAGPLQVLVG